ncbi:UNVERIFIED_CONTAM: hypothetical protein FKN15_010278 [Acipenser sinensis]
MVSESVGAPTTQRMDLKELMEMINRNTAAQIEQTKKWRQELGLPDPEPTELELLLQKWEQASVAPQSPEPEGEELPLPEPRGEEGKSIPPPQPRPPPLQSSSALLRPVPQPLLLDTLPVFLDLPVLDLEPRSLQHWPQLCPWFPAPLSPSTQTSLGCCQTSLLLPLFAASLPLGDRTSLHRFPGEDLGPLRHPPVPRPTLRSALSARWGPMSPVRGPFLAAPEGPTHPQARPCKRAAMDIAGLEAGGNEPYMVPASDSVTEEEEGPDPPCEPPWTMGAMEDLLDEKELLLQKDEEEGDLAPQSSTSTAGSGDQTIIPGNTQQCVLHRATVGGKVQEASSGLGKGHLKWRAKLWSSEKENQEDTEQKALRIRGTLTPERAIAS